jgi:hypothetical protein
VRDPLCVATFAPPDRPHLDHRLVQSLREHLAMFGDPMRVVPLRRADVPMPICCEIAGSCPMPCLRSLCVTKVWRLFRMRNRRHYAESRIVWI